MAAPKKRTVREIRDEQGLTQTALMVRTLEIQEPVSISTIHNVERRRYGRVSDPIRESLAAALGVDVDDIDWEDR